MGDQQRVHPVRDVEAVATSSAASAPRAAHEKRNLSMQRTIPDAVSHPRHHKKQGNLCCRCVCWTLGLILTILIALGVTAAILYLVFRPKLPEYRVDSLRVSNLRINYDLTLYAEFNVKITANNPNEKIGIYYERGGRLGVWYEKTKLCEGPIPRFYQGHRNVTKLDVSLTGSVQYGNALMSALQQQQLQTGRVPLDLKVDAPVAVRLGRLKLRKVRILGDCTLVVDSLSANYRISIKASNCSFGLKL